MRRLRLPPREFDASSCRDEIRRLRELTIEQEETFFAALRMVGCDLSRAICSHLVARLRHWKAECRGWWLPALSCRADNLIDVVCRSVQGERLGWVRGLDPAHDPRGASWREDAGEWLEEARELYDRIGPDPETFNPEKRLYRFDCLLEEGASNAELRGFLAAWLEDGGRADEKRLLKRLEGRESLLEDDRLRSIRSALRKFRRASEEEGDQESEPELPDDWPHWSTVEGRRAALVTIELDERKRKRLEDAFRLRDLDVRPSNSPRRIDALSDSIRQRASVDIVFIDTAHNAHKGTNPVRNACKAAGVECLQVRSASVTSLRRAIERVRGE